MLNKHVHYRDNDRKLIAHFWRTEINNIGGEKPKSVNDFLVLYATGKLTEADYITRARRKVQEHNPLLRGVKWKKRHKEESEVQ